MWSSAEWGMWNVECQTPRAPRWLERGAAGREEKGGKNWFVLLSYFMDVVTVEILTY
jgi:hypothetical protein